mgnify:CR=1 FL=1
MLPDIIPAGQTVVDYSGKQNVSNDAPAAESVPESAGDDPKDIPKAMLIDVENITGKKTVDLEKPLTTVGRGVHNTIVIDADSISGDLGKEEVQRSAEHLIPFAVSGFEKPDEVPGFLD